MKLIAHRGNIKGSNPELENNPLYIDEAIKLKYDVEIDARYDPITQVFWLGHDEPQHKVSWKWMANRHSNIWIHCKDITTLEEFTKYKHSGYQYFWHQEDDYTLTSNNYIWTYPGKPYSSKSILVMPEWNMQISNLVDLKVFDCYGICSDYVEVIS